MHAADIQAIAEGRSPKPWEHIVTHPIYGELTFKAKLPNALMLAAQSVEMDNIMRNLEGEPRYGTMLLVSAIAGAKTMMDLPVVRRTEEEDPDDSSHVKVTQVRYNPETEIDEVFLTEVWLNYSRWRNAFLEPQVQEELGKDSGETAGLASSTSSNDTSGSPSTILA